MKDLCEITSSKRIFAADYQPQGIPFYRGKEITEKYKGNLDVSTELFIDPQKFATIREKFGAPLAGDLLLTSVGTLGSPYVVRAGETFYFKDGNLTWFRKFNDLDSGYLYYWLQSPVGRAELKKCTIGSSQSAYTIVLLKEMEINLPDLPTQRKIAGILSAYDDLIENNLRRIKILEEMALSLYCEWFVHFRFPRDPSEASAMAGGHESAKFVDSPLGQIPKRWEWKKVGDVFEIIGGGTPSTANEEFWTDGDIQWYSPRDLTAESTMFIEKSAVQINQLGLKKSSAKMFPAYSVMLTSRATIGAIAINTVPSCTNQGFITCIPNAEVPLYFLHQWLKANVETFILHASGSTFKEISKGVFKGLDFLQPDAGLVQRYQEAVSPFADQLLNLQRRNQNLRRTRDLLLPNLLSS
jgi:type I restriction enzyme S subunit